MTYIPSQTRYDNMQYRNCGNSGLKLPMVSLGLWHNFGNITPFETQRDLLRTAFDHGITHFDMANNYGPPYGEAERNFGIHMLRDWKPYRDELILSTKAGFDMWPGPYGNNGSRKYLLASLDQSLKRMNVDYVDIFYHHRPDENTPLEETMGALDSAVRQGKALYVGISNYNAEQTRRAVKILRQLGTPLLIHQPRYSMLDRSNEKNLVLDTLKEEKIGCITFSPLAKGLLTGKYLTSIPSDSRIAQDPRYLKPENINDKNIRQVAALKELAQARNQTLSQFALAWILRNEAITSVLIGASKPIQILENVKAIENIHFTEDELRQIDQITLED